jgi:Spy/CpxP family protein refolding chaperone
MVTRTFVAALMAWTVFAQGGGRGIPNLSEAQTAELTRMTAALTSQTQALATARSALAAAAFAEPLNRAGIEARADALGSAELALAVARADAFARLQASAAKLAPNQVAALIAAGGGFRGGQAGGNAAASGAARGTIPGIRERQVNALTRLTTDTMPLNRAVTAARTALAAAVFAEPRDEAAIRAKVASVQAAELALASTRGAAFARIQASPDKLAPDQVAIFAGMGGTFAGLPFTQPDPLNFDQHEGYVSLFDGVSLKGWDGNPKFWRAEGGAIVGESSVQNPSGNTYLVYRNMQAKDFTLKFEIKVEGSGGSGFQYRSKTGIPWLSPIAENVTANVGPVNLDWMLTGPQADFWPSSRDWTGQFYSENTPMRILAWRGQVVEGSGLAAKRLMGNIGDRQALGTLVRMNDWNEYTVIARGGTLIQIVNGQLMAVMVDDDPESSNNQSGLFGIEIEATTKVSVRNIWVKKFN